MTKDQNFLNFELNETLYFEKGQEVLEMLGISLEPDITIQSFDDYIGIRGVIQLQGEYEIDESIAQEERLTDDEDLTPKRYFHRVVEGNNGFSEFYHQFPVEISVPLYRVPDINSISVKVDSFDYELINQNGLRIDSNINIIGISQHSEERETKSNDENQIDEEQLNANSFEFEIREKEEDNQKEVENIDRNADQVIEHVEEQVQVEEDREKKEDRWKYKETQTIEEFLKKDSKTKEKTSTDKKDKKKTTSPPAQEHDHIIVHEQYEEHIEEEQAENVQTDETEEKKKENFFTKWFRGDDDEEEQYSQLRICIVQENDTLEKIAERYEVPKLQILKQNRLDDDHLNEGQLLSIPQKRKK